FYLRRGTAYGRTLARRRQQTEGVSDRGQLMSFRLLRLGFPRAELRRFVSRDVCKRTIGRWLHGFSNQTGPPEATATKMDTDSTAVPAPSLVLNADDVLARMELDEDRFLEAFLERVERVNGSDPLHLIQRRARDLLRAISRAGADHALIAFF